MSAALGSHRAAALSQVRGVCTCSPGSLTLGCSKMCNSFPVCCICGTLKTSSTDWLSREIPALLPFSFCLRWWMHQVEQELMEMGEVLPSCSYKFSLCLVTPWLEPSWVSFASFLFSTEVQWHSGGLQCSRSCCPALADTRTIASWFGWDMDFNGRKMKSWPPGGKKTTKNKVGHAL